MTDPQEILDCMKEIPKVVSKASAGLPPGVVALNIAEAGREAPPPHSSRFRQKNEHLDRCSIKTGTTFCRG